MLKISKNHDFKGPPFDFSAIPGIKRPPLRFSAGAPGEKNSGKVGKWESREIAISEISGFPLDFLIWKMAEIRDFDFPPKM